MDNTFTNWFKEKIMGNPKESLIHLFVFGRNDVVSRIQLLPPPKKRDPVVIIAETHSLLNNFCELYGSFQVVEKIIASKPTILENSLRVLTALETVEKDEINGDGQKEIIVHCRTYSAAVHAVVVALEAHARPWYLATGKLTEPLFLKGATRALTDDERVVMEIIVSEMSLKGKVSMSAILQRTDNLLPMMANKRKESKYRWLRKVLRALVARGVIEVIQDPHDSRKRAIAVA